MREGRGEVWLHLIIVNLCLTYYHLAAANINTKKSDACFIANNVIIPS